MTELGEFFDYWRGRIERDLIPFADPGTRLEVIGDKRHLTAHWLARATRQEAVFSLSLDGGVQVSFRGRSLTYKSFLACSELADLLGLAKMILQTQSPGFFVPTKACLSDDPEAPRRAAVPLLQDLLASEPPDVTRIVMVTGEAGAGKTRVLQALVTEQARLYQHGRTETLYLYINAQGRALARLNEALATELQDLRALLTYHGVSALVRCGILVPIIDGFDELLGVGGYDDAFSSLTGFIEELNGQGQIVASARSTYYEQEFVARASSVSSLGAQAWTQVPLEVVPWGGDEFREYVRLYSQGQNLTDDSQQTLQQRVDAIFSGRNEQLRQKPLFVARTIDILQKEPDFTGGEDLLKELVAAYLERERREKLLDRHGGTLLSAPQMESLFTTLAEEMWNQETRELDKRSIKEIAEYVLLTEGVSEGVQRVVVERMPQLAFLVPGERSAGVAFEHEMFFSYFLAQVFEDKLLKEASGVRVFLSRSVLPIEVAMTAVASIDRVLPLSVSENAQTLLNRLAEAGRVETPRAAQIRENAGIVAGAVLKTGTSTGRLQGIRLWQVVLPGGDLDGVEVRDARVESVEFRRVDLSGARFVRCRGDGLVLSEVVVDPSRSRLEFEGLDPLSQVVGLRVREGGLVRALYDPAEIRRALISCGAIPESVAEEVSTVRAVPEAYKLLLGRLARAYGRTNPVCTADDTLRGLFMDRDWPELERLLVEHGIVTRESRSAKGRPKTFLRRQFLPEVMMAGADRAAVVPPRVRSFWNDLEAGAAAS